ncbi:MAG: HD-GYP domain-containing protein [Gaiellaceae bacterium]
MRGDGLRLLLAGRTGRAVADADPPAANALITVVACVASGALALTVPQSWGHVGGHWLAFLTFLAVTVVLQLVSVQVYNRGAFSFAGSGMLALGFTFGVGAGMVVAALMGMINLVRRHGRLNRGIFDASQFALSVAAGAGVYRAFDMHGTASRVLPAFLGGLAFLAVNTGLLTAAMSVAESLDPREIFKERFRWTLPYHLISGPLALALVVAYQRMGAVGLAAFAAPPAFMMLSVRQYLAKTRESVEEVREANTELEAAVAALEERNADLHELLEFASGLSARAHDRSTLVGYAQEALARVAGTRVRVSDELAGQVPLLAGGSAIGSLEIDDVERLGLRWERLREGLLPQLATALESAQLVDEVRRRHLATIAALSRSMEAKDYYTGGHTERVADVAVAIARRLGFEGSDLDAIQVGALLHDIGKIGIPEAVLHKDGPLDESEWELMRKHPVISDYILSGVDLHPFVRQIARSSHERIDGTGYPDAIGGDEIPLPARIVLVADALDALTTDRPYRQSRPLGRAMIELRAHSGTQFCPTVIAALERVLVEEPHVLTGGHLRAVESGAA